MHTTRKTHWTIIMLGLCALIVAIGLFAGMAWAGSLEPPPEAVDGSGNPVPTTIDALDQLQTDVDTIVLQPIDDGDFRFVDFFDGRVLDNRTGLEWQLSVSTTSRNHANSIAYCDGLTLSGQLDWRLPERDELASLFDKGNPGGNPDLPPGAPFSNVQSSSFSAFYWSASVRPGVPSDAWLVGFTDGFVFPHFPGDNFFAWCVR